MDVAIFQAIQGEVSGAFQGGSDYLLNLANDGAQLAPFHDFDSQVPQSLKDELEELKQGVIDGSISTGWPLPE
jgi:basic membrane protein A